MTPTEVGVALVGLLLLILLAAWYIARAEDRL